MAKICKQIRAEVPDQVGKLAELTGKLAEAGVNILAAAAWVAGGRGQIRLITDDNDKACEAIKGAVDSCEIGEALCVSLPNEAGELNKVVKAIGDAGISIRSVHASAAGEKTLVVLQTADNAKAAELI